MRSGWEDRKGGRRSHGRAWLIATGEGQGFLGCEGVSSWGVAAEVGEERFTLAG